MLSSTKAFFSLSTDFGYEFIADGGQLFVLFNLLLNGSLQAGDLHLRFLEHGCQPGDLGLVRPGDCVDLGVGFLQGLLCVSPQPIVLVLLSRQLDPRLLQTLF